jgi:hypothetical protein
LSLALVVAGACGGQSRGPDRDAVASGEEPENAESEGPAGSASNASSGSSAPSGSSVADPAPGTLPAGGGGTTGYIAGNPAGAVAPGIPPRVPRRHRATAIECDRTRVAGRLPPSSYGEPSIACARDEDCPVVLDCTDCLVACVDLGEGSRCVSGYGECLFDSDCTVGENARCSTGGEMAYCSADKCFDDAACNFGGPCACEGAELGTGNTCLSGNCKTDADCGPDGYCSPSSICPGGRVTGYYCHTPQDSCIDDSDCVNGLQPAGFCAHDSALGHWACSDAGCLVP